MPSAAKRRQQRAKEQKGRGDSFMKSMWREREREQHMQKPCSKVKCEVTKTKL